MACAPPVRPSAPARTLGFSVTGGPGRYPHRMILPCTSTPPLSVLPPSSAVASPRPWSTDEGLKERNASLELLAPSALRIGAPFSSLPPLERVSGTRCRASRKLHPQGLATLSVVCAIPDPREPLSAPDTLGVRPSEPFSSPMIEGKVSFSLFRSCPFPPNLPGLASGLQRLPPIGEAVPPSASLAV